MNPTTWKRLTDLAARQHGVVARHQLGIDGDTWRRAIRSHRLVTAHPNVASVAGCPPNWEQRTCAAVLAVGPNALASHRTAANLHGLVDPADERARVEAGPIDVLVPDRRRRSFDGVICHRPTDLGRLHPARLRGIPCTNLLRTLCDLGAVDDELVDDAVGAALTSRRVRVSTLETVLAEHARHGRAGIVALRRAIDRHMVDRKPADSVLEPAFGRLVDRHRLPPVIFHPRVGRYTPDFWVVGTCVLLECDGWAHHALDRTAFERDRRRDADLVAAGWIVVRFSYRSVTERPAATAQRIRSAVTRWSELPVPAGLVA